VISGESCAAHDLKVASCSLLLSISLLFVRGSWVDLSYSVLPKECVPRGALLLSSRGGCEAFDGKPMRVVVWLSLRSCARGFGLPLDPILNAFADLGAGSLSGERNSRDVLVRYESCSVLTRPVFG
jgi:hypothetical protein